MNWLERYVKVLHFFNVLYVWLIVIGVVKRTFDSRTWLRGLCEDFGIWEALRIISVVLCEYLYFAIGFMVFFLILMTSEAILRLLPAVLRYWMAISEDATAPTT